jgi:hypothetical protein
LEKKIKPGKTKTKTQTLDMARFKKKILELLVMMKIKKI